MKPADYAVLIGLGIATSIVSYFSNSLLISSICAAGYAATIYTIWNENKRDLNEKK